jgi:hypothetical protein
VNARESGPDASTGDASAGAGGTEGAAEPTVARRGRLWAWLATFFAFTCGAHGNFETTDAGFTLLAATNLWQRGDSGILRTDQGATTIAENEGAKAIAAGISGKLDARGVAYTWFPVGHVWLLVPFAVAGDALERAWPEVDAAFRARYRPGGTPEQAANTLEGVQGRPVLTQGLIALVVPPACAATILLLLFLLARTFGAAERDAWTGALAIVFATQAFAFGRETLSDGPGLVCLLASVLAVARVDHGGRDRTAFLGGLVAGASVLLRYQNAALQLAIGSALVLACWRQRRWRALGAFVLGVLPAAIALLAVNHARFGDPLDTGYPAVGAWLTEPMWLGAVKMLFAAGRGVAWLSPLVWLALPFAVRARHTSHWRWLAWVVFLFPLGFFALAQGWQGGQCWGARYVTHGLVLLLAITLPQARPWQRWPRAWWALVALGVLANLTSVVAPTRGVLQLADQAAEARGDVDSPDADSSDVVSWHPRYTPLLANWRYAVASHTGRFEDRNQQPVAAEPPAISIVFGTAPVREKEASSPVRWEDRGGRHLAVRFWGAVFGVSSLLLLAPSLGLALLFLWLARRAAPAGSAPPPAPASPPARAAPAS